MQRDLFPHSEPGAVAGPRDHAPFEVRTVWISDLHLARPAAVPTHSARPAQAPAGGAEPPPWHGPLPQPARVLP
jgi:hypothetical protein